MSSRARSSHAIEVESLASFWGVEADPGPSELERRFQRLLTEGYLGSAAKARRQAVRVYYRIKPHLPRQAQLFLRRRIAHGTGRTRFPRWPIEDSAWSLANEWLAGRVRDHPEGLVGLGFWPGGARCAVVLTHDVEEQRGFDSIEAIAEMEERVGLRSSWNIVPERYRVDEALLRGLRERGHEVGVHGLNHDGRLFSSRREFRSRLEKIHVHAERWGAAGFRSPATHRNVAWMQELRFTYDASFFDTDPYEPQPGGCCHVFPFRMGRLIELPYTLAQDHTLFEILRTDALQAWMAKASWIRSVGGMVLLITHPDYLLTERRRAVYRELLIELKAWHDAWHALPAEVAEWWKARADGRGARDEDGRPAVTGSDPRLEPRVFRGPARA